MSTKQKWVDLSFKKSFFTKICKGWLHICDSLHVYSATFVYTIRSSSYYDKTIILLYYWGQTISRHILWNLTLHWTKQFIILVHLKNKILHFTDNLVFKKWTFISETPIRCKGPDSCCWVKLPMSRSAKESVVDMTHTRFLAKQQKPAWGERRSFL